jgi:membrane-associated protein
MDQYSDYIVTYGYFAIFIFLYLGITGIPSPEESFMLFVGLTISQGSLNLYHSIFLAFLGVTMGMVSAYAIGYVVGKPLFYRFGKFIGLPPHRFKKATEKFKKNANWAIITGFFIPGIRQINPYMAGISRIPFFIFLLTSVIGSFIWTVSIILIGTYLGNRVRQFIHITPFHLALIGVAFLIFFILFVVGRFLKRKRSTG